MSQVGEAVEPVASGESAAPKSAIPVADIIAGQSWLIEPEAFQSRLIESLTACLLRDNPRPCLLRAPTASGKTYILSKVLQRVSEASRTVWFWFVPFINLVQQTEDSLASHTHGLLPTSIEGARNREPVGGLVVIATSQSVSRARSRNTGYTDGADDDARSLSDLVSLARARGLSIGLVVDEAHIALDSQTEFGQFAHWLAPERLVMASATPKDQRLLEFIEKAGYSAYDAFNVSRDEVVEARLNKRYIEAVVYDLRESMQTIADLQTTVLVQGWKRSQLLKRRLAAMGIPVVPLLLVQVANGADSVAEARGHLMNLCGVPAHAIGEHSSATPDPVLMASIANDSTKEVLIFKQSAGTGFDAPRAFVLASTKPVNDPDFATQFIGRVMRVHRAIRAYFPRPAVIDPALDTACIYLANAEAQQGFEQAVAASAGVRNQLEGLTEKLVLRRMASGAVMYTNRPTDEPPLFAALPFPSAEPPAADGEAEGEGETRAATTERDWPLDLFSFDADAGAASTSAGQGGETAAQSWTQFGLDMPVTSTGKPSAPVGGAGTPGQAGRAGQRSAGGKAGPPSKAELLAALDEMGVRAYVRRTDLPTLPAALQRESRPEMSDMARASRSAAARMEIPAPVQKMAVNVALGRVREKEIRTELTQHQRTEQDVTVVVERGALAREVQQVLSGLPQVEEEDANIIKEVLTQRMLPLIQAELADLDEDARPNEAQLRRMARDAAYWVIRRTGNELSEILYDEIAARAVTSDASPLPDAMVFPASIGLEVSGRGIYGVLPPSKDDIESIASVLPLDARALLRERIEPIAAGALSLSGFDGSHALGEDERKFARALDRASFVLWWHRNAPRKEYSVRLVRGEHKDYFHPDFVVCLEHFPGDEPLMRLIDPKHDVKDAVRKAKHASALYGRVLFITRDQAKLRCVEADGRLGDEVDLDDLEGMREWLRRTRPSGR